MSRAECAAYHGCTYRGCRGPVTTRLSTRYGGMPWYSCDAHADAMASALKYGIGSTEQVDVTDYTPPAN